MRRLPIAKLAGLGAFAAAGGIILIYALLVFITIPRPETAGIDWTNAAVTWISVGIVVLALVAPHVVYGKVLLDMASEEGDARQAG